jgi:tetratricopeptide (TPR) repeat protein
MFNKIIELDPKNALAYYNKGSVFRNIHRRNEAFQCYNKAMELDYKTIKTYPNYN